MKLCKWDCANYALKFCQLCEWYYTKYQISTYSCIQFVTYITNTSTTIYRIPHYLAFHVQLKHFPDISHYNFSGWKQNFPTSATRSSPIPNRRHQNHSSRLSGVVKKTSPPNCTMITYEKVEQECLLTVQQCQWVNNRYYHTQMRIIVWAFSKLLVQV